MKTPFLQSAALQPGVARKAKICHTKTVNIDLICSDGAQRALEMSTRIAEGALQAAVSDDNVFGESQKAGANLAGPRDRTAKNVNKVVVGWRRGAGEVVLS